MKPYWLGCSVRNQLIQLQSSTVFLNVLACCSAHRVRKSSDSRLNFVYCRYGWISPSAVDRPTPGLPFSSWVLEVVHDSLFEINWFYLAFTDANKSQLARFIPLLGSLPSHKSRFSRPRISMSAIIKGEDLSVVVMNHAVIDVPVLCARF